MTAYCPKRWSSSSRRVSSHLHRRLQPAIFLTPRLRAVELTRWRYLPVRTTYVGKVSKRVAIERGGCDGDARQVHEDAP
jgi:hypothetical protein